MSVTINGTSGVTTPGITNSEGYTGDGLTIAAGAPAGALQIDASGNAGLGVGPSAKLTVAGALPEPNSAATYPGTIQIMEHVSGSNANVFGGLEFKSTSFSAGYGWKIIALDTGAGVPITFNARDNSATWTERMRLDASGNLLVGTTSANANVTASDNTAGNAYYIAAGIGSTVGLASTAKNDYALQLNRQGNTDGVIAGFRRNGTLVGSIFVTGSATAYSTSSDYRLKENIQPMTGALDKIAALKPVTYNWKVDGSADRGFIAHELQEVIPQAVSGEKDAVDDEGNIQPQGVDYGKITPELVAAIQEQQAMITELKARIEQLEAK